jgi:hypothetical protein
LNDATEMQQLQQQLRDQVNRFQLENNQLKFENQRLAQCAKRLNEVEQDLRHVAQLEGKNIQTLMEQVEEYRHIQKEIETSLQAKIIQNLMEVVIRSDDDDDFIIDKNEVDGLMTRLKSINGVNFSEDNFKQAIVNAGFNAKDVLEEQGGFDLKVVMKIIQNLLDDRQDQKVFVLTTSVLLPKELRVQMQQDMLVGSY